MKDSLRAPYGLWGFQTSRGSRLRSKAVLGLQDLRLQDFTVLGSGLWGSGWIWLVLKPSGKKGLYRKAWPSYEYRFGAFAGLRISEGVWWWDFGARDVESTLDFRWVDDGPRNLRILDPKSCA